MKLESESNCDDDEASHCHRHRVSFSETSTVHVFENERDDRYQSNVAYSPEDLELLAAEARQEAYRINELIITAPQNSRIDSIKYLLKNKIVNKVDFIGLEHLALDKSSSRGQIRKSHSDAVLMKQDELWRRRQQQQQPHLQDLAIALALGKFAKRNSLESRNLARARATLCRESRRSLLQRKKRDADAECPSAGPADVVWYC